MISKSSETEFPLGGQAQLDNAPASDHLLLESPPTSDSNRDAEDSPPSGQPSSANDREALYDRNFFVALVSQTSFVIANTLLAHYARWIEFLGGNLQQVGWVMGIGAASGLVLRPFLAQCINRLGAKTTWGLGYVIFAVAAAANYFLVDIDASLFLLRALSVLGSALVFASSLTYISQVAPESRRTEAIGTLGCGGFLGMLVGPVLGDFFLQAEVRSRPEFMTLFFVAAAANIVPLALLYSLRSPNPSNLQKHKMQ
ncbi:MAG: MFS transporter, partial [Pirellulaceae bacterium]